MPRTTVANLEKNTQTILEMIREAAEKKVQVVAFPELSLTSYSLGDLLRQPAIIEGAETMLSRLPQGNREARYFLYHRHACAAQRQAL